MLGRIGDTDGENRLDTAGEGEGEVNWESSTDINTLSHESRELVGSCCITQGAQPGALWWPGGGGVGERREPHEGEERYVYVYSYCYMAETNNILKQFSPIKK